jgi:antitoxin ParD1/3/4
MNVSLTPELEDLVEQKVQSGMYHTASEVVRDALRLLKERDDLHSRRIEHLRHDIAVGLKDLDEGKSALLTRKTLQGIKTRARARLTKAKEKSQK